MRTLRRAEGDVMRDDRADEHWMRAYAADDRGALGALFDRYAHRFLGLYRHCFQDEALAEQLLEATFAEVHRLRRCYRARMVARTWLFGIAARVCVQALRRGDRRGAGPAAAGGGDSAVRAAVGELDGSARLVLYLHRYEGMSFGEIADVLGSTPLEVRTQAEQTYSTLHERLRPWIERAFRGGMS